MHSAREQAEFAFEEHLSAGKDVIEKLAGAHFVRAY
jgi:hypothetical protein